MAKNDTDLFDRLTAAGMRKKVARKVSRAAETSGPNGAPEKIQSLVGDLEQLIAEAKDRVSGGPARRSAAAKKAAETRRRAAASRSAAAQKAARTRARNAAR